MQSSRSPKDTSVKLFTSEMVGAPSLTQAAGTLIGVLSACLVNGFGMQQVSSFVVTQGLGQITVPVATGWERMCVIDVAGCTDASYNGEYKLTQVSADGLRVSFPIDAPDGTVQGAAITVKLAPAGWLLRFADPATNKAVYMPGTPQWLGHCLWLHDVRGTHSRARGYESMIDLDTGFGPWPTDAQVPGGGYVYKAWGTTRPSPWALVCDDKCAHIGIAPGVSANEANLAWVFRTFGIMQPLADTDLHAVLLSVQTDASLNNASVGAGTLGAVQTAVNSSLTFARSADGVGTAVTAFPSLLSAGTNGDSGNDISCGPQSGVDVGKLIFAEKFLRVAANGYPRAKIPGVLHLMHSGGRPAKEVSVQGRLHKLWQSTPSGGNLAYTGCALPIDVEGPWR